MNTKKVVKTILNIADRLENEVRGSHYINYGGCCWYAAHLAEQIEKYGVSFKAVLIPEIGLEDDEDHYDDYAIYHASMRYVQELEEDILNFESTGGNTHIGISINGEIYDSKGISTMMSESARNMAVDPIEVNWGSKMLFNYNKIGSWNTTFEDNLEPIKQHHIKTIIQDEFKNCFGY